MIVLFYLWLLLAILALSAILLAAHRLEARRGLAPTLALLGGLAALLQFQAAGWLPVGSAGGIAAALAVAWMPVLVLGLLVVYIANGTRPARAALAAMLGVMLLVALALAARSAGDAAGMAFIARAFLSAGLRLALGATLAVVLYQALSNQLSRRPVRRPGRPPSLIAALLALLAAAWLETLWNGALWSAARSGSLPPGMASALAVQFAADTLAALGCWSVLAVYLRSSARPEAGLPAAGPRPVLDFLAPKTRPKPRARPTHNLLVTIGQIDRLIMRTEDAHQLLESACQLLVSQQGYPLVWVGLIDSQAEEMPRLTPTVVAHAPQFQPAVVPQIGATNGDESNPLLQALHQRRPLTVDDLGTLPSPPGWIPNAAAQGLHQAAFLPMRHGDHALGVLAIFQGEQASRLELEIGLLQELADDLAHALVSLEARHQQAILHTASENMRDGLLITNPRGQIIYANTAVAAMVGRTVKALHGQPVQAAFASGVNQMLIEQHLASLQTRKSVEFQIELQGAEGTTCYFAMRASVVQYGPAQQAYYVINVREITQRRLYEQQLLTLNQLVTDFTKIHNVKELLERVLLDGERLLQADASGIYLVSSDSTLVTDSYTHGLPDEYISEVMRSLKGLPGGTVMRTRQPVFVNDVLNDPYYGERVHFMAEHGVRALIILPIVFQNEGIGACVLYYRKPHTFSEQEIQLGLTLARALAITLQNARLYESERNQRGFADALGLAAAAINSSLDPELVLDRILEKIMEVIHCRSVNIMLIEGDKARVVRNLDELSPGKARRHVLGLELPLTLPTFQSMLETGEPLIIPNTAMDPVWHQLEQSTWIRSYAAAPLLVQKTLIGFLNMNSDQVDYFTQDIQSQLQAFANTAAVAILNAQLYRRIQEHANQLEDRVQERTAELQAAKERIESILVSVPDAVLVLDGNYRVAHANPTGKRLVAQAEAQGLDLFAGDFLENLAERSAPGEMNVVEIGERAYQALASPLTSQDGNGGMVIVFRDVTRFRDLDQLKSQFVSDVSHELRTPLTNLSLYLDLLGNVKDPARLPRYMDTLRRETDRLTHLIEDLLTISRLEAGRVEIDLKPVDVNPLVSNLVDDRRPMATSRNLSMTFSPCESLPRVMADARLLTQVLSNLLTNALNYTPAQNAIHLETALRSENNAQWITISVQDNGYGISPDEQEQIFSRFFRGAASQASGAPGTGLGLAISREIITRMGGKITLKSEPGEGSVFTVWLPAML